jgi:hypothetical protein
MTAETGKTILIPGKPVLLVSGTLVAVGAAAFAVSALGPHPARAWQAYLINFLFWSAIAQGGLVFSAVMHLTRARWSGSLAGVAESFVAFFPISFVLFSGLLLGREHLFPWLGQDLHGKEVWLNLPFLFSRDAVGLIVLYGLGFAYVYNALGLKLLRAAGGRIDQGTFSGILFRREAGEERGRQRMTVLAILYILAFAIVLSLLGYDLVMAMDPHWYSTLFGAYTFVKAFYVGLGGVIILAAALSMAAGDMVPFEKSHFHDIGKLFLGFCLVWADFFYCQFVVIWYGNIPEETAYIIERTMRAPYNYLAWFVFTVCFILPFLILLNRKIKMMLKAMIVLCSIVLGGIWLEHLLLIGPALSGHRETLPLGVWDGVMTLGFLGLMVFSLVVFLNRFPEIVTEAGVTPDQKESH